MVGSGQAAQQQQQQTPGFGSMGPIMNPHQGGPLIRQQIRGAMASRPQQAGMYPGNPAAVMQGPMRQGLPGQPGQMFSGGPGVNSSSAMAAPPYGGYQQGAMMNSAGVGATGASMMSQGYQQGGYQGPGMMGMRQPQQGYLSQSQMVQRPAQYMQVRCNCQLSCSYDTSLYNYCFIYLKDKNNNNNK